MHIYVCMHSLVGLTFSSAQCIVFEVVFVFLRSLSFSEVAMCAGTHSEISLL